MADPEDVAAYQAYVNKGGRLSFNSWVAQGKPGVATEDELARAWEEENVPPEPPPGNGDEPLDDVLTGDQLLYDNYLSNGGTLGYTNWLAQNKPTGPSSETEAQDQMDHNAYRHAGGTLSFDDWLAQNKPAVTGQESQDYAAWRIYNQAGGTSDYASWLVGGKPAGPDDKPPPPPPPPPPDGGNGDGEDDFSAQLAAAMERIRQESREAYESRRAEAQRLGARRTGKMSRMQQQALLARGRTAGEIEQLTAGGQEAGQRSLNDLLQALSVGQKQRQAEIGRMGIGAMISGEELGIRERQLAQQEAQYQQTFGLSQQQLAQQATWQQGRLGLGRQQAQASIWGPLAGALGSIGGGALGSIFGPAGTAIGAGIGKWVGPGGGGWFGGRG